MTDIYDFITELAKIDVEFQDKNGRFYCLKSYIKRLEDNNILIETPTVKGISYNLPIGMKISITIFVDDGVYMGESHVIGKELSSISGLLISYPVFTQQIQRREYLRVPLNLEVEMSFYLDKTRKKIHKVRLRDISGSGFSYISYTPVGQYYDVTCKINLDNDPIISRCEHVYTKQATIHEESKYIHAFGFVDITQKNVERIVKASFKYQVELRKKGFIMD